MGTLRNAPVPKIRSAGMSSSCAAMAASRTAPRLAIGAWRQRLQASRCFIIGPRPVCQRDQLVTFTSVFAYRIRQYAH